MADAPEIIAKRALEAIAEIVALVNDAPRVPTEVEELRTLNAALRAKVEEHDAERIDAAAERLELQQANELLQLESEGRKAAEAQISRIGIGLGQLIMRAERLHNDRHLLITEVQAVMQAASRDDWGIDTSAGHETIDDAQAVLNARATSLTCANCGRPIIAWPPSSPTGHRHVRGAELYCHPPRNGEPTDGATATPSTTDTESETPWTPQV